MNRRTCCAPRRPRRHQPRGRLPHRHGHRRHHRDRNRHASRLRPPRPLARPGRPVPGVEELDLAAPYEVLSASDHFTERDVEVRYVTLDGPRTITAAFGTRLRADHRWAPEEADLLVVPGGGYARPEAPGVRAEIRRGALPRALAAARRPGLTIAALRPA